MSPACDREREMKTGTSVRGLQALNPEPGATGGAAQTHARHGRRLSRERNAPRVFARRRTRTRTLTHR